MKKIEQKSQRMVSAEAKEALYDKPIAERKPAWSEEDDLMLLSTIQSLEMTNGAAQMKIDWLKSLKDRITWKPSKEQMEALLFEAGAWDEDSANGINLTSLYNDLKKL